MFSYRHAFHAGNHADVLKHVILIQLLSYMNQKETPYMVVDTHAGAGVYNLDDAFASKNAEYESGITRLWDRTDLPPAVADYVKMVKAMNPSGKLRHYPGSPFIAEQVMREADRLRLFDLHPTEGKVLAENFRKLEAHKAAQGQRPTVRGKRVMVERSDGFGALKTLLPPPSRRALVLTDPSFEDKRDYRLVKDTLSDALKRFPTGIYAVWYPVLQRMESRQFPGQLKRLPANGWLHATLSIGGPSPDGFGLRGSGMFIINPPWTLEATLREILPWLKERLAIDSGANFELETGQTVTGNAGPRRP
jgi:23S rRNA (adenine2030-N6)-methyltransferase